MTAAPAADLDLRLSRSRLRFVNAQIEADFRAEHALLEQSALRLTAVVALAMTVGALLVQLTLDGAQVGQSMSQLLLAAIAFETVILMLALRLPPSMQPALAFVFGLGAVTAVSIGSPLVMLAHAPVDLLVRYGYFGPVLVAMLPYLFLRMRLLQGLAINLLAAGSYVLVILGADGVPPLDRFLHAHNVMFGVFGATAGGWLLEHLTRQNFAQRRLIEAREKQLALANQQAERLLLNILPASIARRLRQHESPIADSAACVSVVFADLVGFTPLAARLPAADVVRLLDCIFRRFDELAAEHGMEKIKTIGDAYLAVSGLPEPRADHAAAAAGFALDIRDAVSAFSREHRLELSMRIGIDSGPVIAGVIGSHKFSYDLWGDTVNTASRMESHGAPGQIQVTTATAQQLAKLFVLEERGEIPVKGKGPMQTWWLRHQNDPPPC